MRALRTAWNYLAGRKKTEERTNLSFCEVVHVIESLDPAVSIDIVFGKYVESYLSPREATNLLEGEFRGSLLYHIGGLYQVFSGRKNKKHYLEVRQRNVVNGLTRQKATLSFLVENKSAGEKKKQNHLQSQRKLQSTASNV